MAFKIMTEKLFDLNDYKNERPAQELKQLDQMKRFLLEKRSGIQGDEQIVLTYQDYLQFCADHQERALSQSRNDFAWAVSFWFGVADILSAQGKIKAKRIYYNSW